MSEVKVTVVTEGGRQTVTFEDGDPATVAELIRLSGSALNISPNANIAVDGAPATLDTVLEDGAEVTTTKPAGRKGQ